MLKVFIRLLTVFLLVQSQAPSHAMGGLGHTVPNTSHVYENQALATAALTFLRAPERTASWLWRIASTFLKEEQVVLRQPAGEMDLFGPMAMSDSHPGTEGPMERAVSLADLIQILQPYGRPVASAFFGNGLEDAERHTRNRLAYEQAVKRLQSVRLESIPDVEFVQIQIPAQSKEKEHLHPKSLDVHITPEGKIHSLVFYAQRSISGHIQICLTDSLYYSLVERRLLTKFVDDVRQHLQAPHAFVVQSRAWPYLTPLLQRDVETFQALRGKGMQLVARYGEELRQKGYDVVRPLWEMGHSGSGYRIRFLIASDRKRRQSVVIQIGDVQANFIELFKRPGMLSHPRVVNYHESGFFEDKQTYLVMDYAEGESLESVMARRESSSIMDMTFLLFQFLDALAYWHGYGIPHGDLSPYNVHWNPDFSIVLMDPVYTDPEGYSKGRHKFFYRHARFDLSSAAELILSWLSANPLSPMPLFEVINSPDSLRKKAVSDLVDQTLRLHDSTRDLSTEVKDLLRIILNKLLLNNFVIFKPYERFEEQLAHESYASAEQALADTKRLIRLLLGSSLPIPGTQAHALWQAA